MTSGIARTRLIDDWLREALRGERGLALLADAGADEYRARYWGERGRRMRGFAFYRVALAEVHGA
jgi:hypothetical protein